MLCISNPCEVITDRNIELYSTGAIERLDAEYLALECNGYRDPQALVEKLQSARALPENVTLGQLEEVFGGEASYYEKGDCWFFGCGVRAEKNADGGYTLTYNG